MGLLVPKLRGFSRQWSGGSHLWSRRLVVCEARVEHNRSSKSVDSWQLFVIYKTKFRRCQPSLTPVYHVSPLGGYLCDILRGGWALGLTTSPRLFWLRQTTDYRQRLGGCRMGLRRTTRQRVNETTSGVVATCSLVVLQSRSLVVSQSAKRQLSPRRQPAHDS